MANHMFDNLIDSLEAEHKRAGASAGAKKARPERDQYGRKFMTDRDVERHMQALRVYRQWDPTTALYNGDNSCIARILGADPWFKQNGLVLLPDMSLHFDGEYGNNACEKFFGQQASNDEESVELPDSYDGDYIIGYDWRNWWDNDFDADVDVSAVCARITNLLKAHEVEV